MNCLVDSPISNAVPCLGRAEWRVLTDSAPPKCLVDAPLQFADKLEPMGQDVDRGAMDEASTIASFYQGVPHAIGVERHEAYLRQKEFNRAGK